MSSTHQDEDPASDRKWFATLQARAALIGATLTRMENDAGRVVYVISKWSLTRELQDLDAVEAWLDRVGAPG